MYNLSVTGIHYNDAIASLDKFFLRSGILDGISCNQEDCHSWDDTEWSAYIGKGFHKFLTWRLWVVKVRRGKIHDKS
jgi:hypothetical protein